MRSVAAVLVVLCALLSAGCATSESEPAGSPTTSGPSVAPGKAAETALRGYLRAADAGDCRAVKRLVLAPELVDCAEIRANAGQWSAGGNDLATVPISADLVDDSGLATVTWANGGEDTWDLQQVDGSWLVLDVDAADDV